MSQIIPGGRPRASSDGDILDDGLSSTLFVNLNDHSGVTRKSNRKASANVFVNNNNKQSEYLDSSNDTFDSDGELSSPSQSGASRSRRKGLFFTSMRKAVSRAFVKDSRPNTSSDSTLKKSEKTNHKVWTPELKHAGEERNSNNFNGNEPSDSNRMSSSRPLIADSGVGATGPKWKKTPGTIGIYNHGNSCFMNAVLQCLSNTDSFTEYFIKDFYKSDLKNSSNGKRGMFRSNHGEVTEQLGHLLKCLWSGKYTNEVSKEFKAVIGKFNNQYKGDHQHDAQEFLLWLLGRIHEDVSTNNKKKTKPQKAPVLKSDEEQANEAATANGESFVLKLFQALHSSTLTCPTCGERSSTFDPYLCVSLPLPQRCPRAIYVIVVSLEPHHFHEVKIAVTLNQYDGVKELRELISTKTKIPLKQLLLVQLNEDDFGATYSDEQPISYIPENETVYAIEAFSDDASMQNSVQEFDTPTSQLLVMHVETPGGSARGHRFGSPVMLKVRRDITWKGLQKEIILKMEDSVREEILSQPQKLSTNLFTLRVYDGSSHKNYLPSNVDMPLYTQSAERAYTTLDEDFGPPHIKIIAEWEPQVKKTVVIDDQEHVEIDSSVTEVQNNPPGQNKVSLDECFKLYTQEEKLSGEDAWLCPHCKQQQQGTIKTLKLWSLPDVLVLHLKRFQQTCLARSKLNTLIEFPVENLDMSAHLTHRIPTNPLKRDDYCYDLLGVSNHYGNMSGGHYISYCRSPVDGEWREFNDAKVHILQGPIATREAYLLFYQRRSLSKEVNQRLFTGDHWVFSLPLAPPDMIENKASDEICQRNGETNHQPRQSRSRSASPSAHWQNNKEGAGLITRRLPNRPLTPQPFRRPISYTENKGFEDDEEDDDDSSLTSPSSPEKNSPTRISRPVQRQVSAPGPQGKRDKSAGASLPIKLKEPSRSLYNRRSVEVDQDFTAEQSKKTDSTNGVVRSLSQSRSKSSDKPPPQVTVVRHDPPKIGDMSLKSTNHQVLISNGIDTDTKYTSSSYDRARYLDSKKSIPMFEPASALQVKFDDKDNYSNPNQKPYHDSSFTSENETARKKLAQLVKQDSLSRGITERVHYNIDPIEEESNFVRNGSRVCELPKTSELARMKPIHVDYLGNVNISKAGSGSYSNRQETLDSRDRDSEVRRDRRYNPSSMYSTRGTGYSLLDETEGDYFVNLDLPSEQPPRDIRSRLGSDKHQGFCKLADKHFGETDRLLEYEKPNFRTRFADDTEYHSSDYVSPDLIGDISRLKKYSTISRTTDTSQAGRYERDIIPRSSTDYNIHYNNPNLLPPPSPTPLHSLREEQIFNHAAVSTSLPSTTNDYLNASRLTSREISAIQSYEFAGKRSGDSDNLLSTGTNTLPGYYQGSRVGSKYNFRRPRAMWGLQTPKPVQGELGKIPTPCLRESSV